MRLIEKRSWPLPLERPMGGTTDTWSGRRTQRSRTFWSSGGCWTDSSKSTFTWMPSYDLTRSVMVAMPTG